MNLTEIPLLNDLLKLFKGLRDCGLPLGVDDYLLALEALQGGFGIGDRQALEQLCCTLWTKSPDDAIKLHKLLNKLLEQAQTDTEQSSTVKSSPVKEKFDPSRPEIPLIEPEPSADSSIAPPVEETSQASDSFTETFESRNEGISPADLPLEIEEPEQVIQAIRSSKRDRSIMIYPRQHSGDEYLPVTSRQIKQSWRFLRRPVREGTLDALDVGATIAQVSQQGVLLKAMLMPRYVNRTLLVLLVDQNGSMVPFHHLSHHLIDKAQQGGNITQTRVYYFHNYPEEYIYHDSTCIKAQLLTEVLDSIDQKAAVLIVSDAGAARGYYNSERVEYTQEFIEKIKQSVRYYAWLNPMPNDSWQHTTAGDIAGFVPMFEMSHQGLNAAINTLRGRYVYCDRPYSWML
ncbi:hypothetical protein [Nostoc sp.]|uniref:hypothetical protein n=1 Tax=Nostoc sp. TaxID=1180 RepID=UPI00359436E7